MNELKPEEITKEKSLFAIFRASIFVLPISKLNAYSTLLVATFLFCIATNPSTSEKLMMISLIKFSEIGLNFSGAILGFLIAGLTIFASVSDKKIFVDMASIVEPKTNLTYLKYNFFSLLYVFIVYLGFTIFCFLIQLLGSNDSPFSLLISTFMRDHDFLKRVFIRFFYCLFSTWFFYVLILLQSFIFNIYHMVMTSIRWEVEDLIDKN